MARSKLSMRSKGTVDALVQGGINGKKHVLCTVDDQGVMEFVTALDNASQATQPTTREKQTPAATRQRAPAGDIYMTPQSTAVPEAAVHAEGPGHTANPLTDVESVPTKQVTHSFRLKETEKVQEFLSRCLVRLQQQVVKRIAKQWIKAICPKKQARYPYQDKRRERQEGKEPEVPEWWPTDECDFREPDHITKEHRLSLCLHLLRLRAAPAQLKEWSGNGDISDSVKVLETENWTAFLKSLTPPSIFEGLDPEKKKRGGWEKELNEMYRVADMEESYLRHERDGNDVYSWTEETAIEPVVGRPRRQAIRKRTRQSSRVSDSSSRRSSERSTSSERVLKKYRRTAEASQPSPNAQLASKMSNTGLDERTYAQPVEATVRRNTIPNIGGLPGVKPLNVTGSHHGLPVTFEQHPDPPRTGSEVTTPTFAGWPPTIYYYARSQMNSPGTTAFTSSFGSVHQEQENTFNASHHQEVPATNFPGWRDYPLNRPDQGTNAVKVCSAQYLRQPQFDTVPNTPVYSPVPCFQPNGYADHEGPMCPGYGSPEMRYALASQQHQPQENEMVPTRVAYGPPHVPAGFVTQAQYPTVPPEASPMALHQQQDCYECKQIAYQQHLDYQVTQPTFHNVQQPPCDGQVQPYPETMPEEFFPSTPLPGGVVRGFTGHASGVGCHTMV